MTFLRCYLVKTVSKLARAINTPSYDTGYWRVPVTPDLLPTVLIAFVKGFDAIYLRL